MSSLDQSVIDTRLPYDAKAMTAEERCSRDPMPLTKAQAHELIQRHYCHRHEIVPFADCEALVTFIVECRRVMSPARAQRYLRNYRGIVAVIRDLYISASRVEDAEGNSMREPGLTRLSDTMRELREVDKHTHADYELARDHLRAAADVLSGCEVRNRGRSTVAADAAELSLATEQLYQRLSAVLDDWAIDPRVGWHGQEYGDHERTGGNRYSPEALAARKLWSAFPEQLRAARNTPPLWQPYGTGSRLLKFCGIEVDPKAFRMIAINAQGYNNSRG